MMMEEEGVAPVRTDGDGVFVNCPVNNDSGKWNGSCTRKGRDLWWCRYGR